jgi:hypothetical protein
VVDDLHGELARYGLIERPARRSVQAAPGCFVNLRPQRPLELTIGFFGSRSGDKRKQMLCLRSDGELALVAGNSALTLSQFIDYGNGKYSLDQAAIRQQVDSATTADSRYTPTSARREVRKLETQTMYESWQREYRRLTKSRPKMSDV